jgi:hypothetical protein
MNGWVIWCFGLFLYDILAQPMHYYDNLFGVLMLACAAISYNWK